MSRSRTKGWGWSRQAATILRRDQVCRWCGAGDRLQADHVVEVRHGGSDDPSNLLALCIDCHRTKTNATEAAAHELVRRHYPEFHYILTEKLGRVPRGPRPVRW